MQIPVSEAKSQLTELVRRAEAGEEVILTRHGHPTVRLAPVRTAPDAAAKRAVLDEVRRSALQKARQGESAARSQDFLYDEQGLPEKAPPESGLHN
jgi:prevent-host-death family protein